MLQLRSRGRDPIARVPHEPVHVLLQLRDPGGPGHAGAAAHGAVKGSGHGRFGGGGGGGLPALRGPTARE